MSGVVIKAEKLGKTYIIGHQAEDVGYLTFRDVLTQSALSLWNKTRDLMQGKPVIQGDALEELWALRDVSFEIQRGEAVGIIGSNGAGKSTLLKILSRITEPSAGRVSIRGRVASLLEVGTGFHPELSGRENIYLNGAILGMTRVEIKRKFDEIVAFADVEKFLDTPVKRYSSGMYVRLAFAVAAHLEPEILVIDEVLAVGDAAFQKKCLRKMGDVAQEGRTVLFVSHNIASVLQLCGRGILLERGTVTQTGSARQVADHYLQDAAYGRNREVDLSKRRRRVSLVDSPFRIMKVSLLGGSDQLIYRIGELLQFEICFLCDAVLADLRVGLGINTITGQRLCTFHSPAGFSPARDGMGRLILSVATDCLKPGTYTVHVGARSGKVDYDEVPDVTSFEVCLLTTEGCSDDDDNFGFVSVEHSWAQGGSVQTPLD